WRRRSPKIANARLAACFECDHADMRDHVIVARLRLFFADCLRNLFAIVCEMFSGLFAKCLRNICARCLSCVNKRETHGSGRGVLCTFLCYLPAIFFAAAASSMKYCSESRSFFSRALAKPSSAKRCAAEPCLADNMASAAVPR